MKKFQNCQAIFVPLLGKVTCTQWCTLQSNKMLSGLPSVQNRYTFVAQQPYCPTCSGSIQLRWVVHLSQNPQIDSKTARIPYSAAAAPRRDSRAHSKSPLDGACVPVQTRNVRLWNSVEDNTSLRLLYCTATVHSGPKVWLFFKNY